MMVRLIFLAVIALGLGAVELQASPSTRDPGYFLGLGEIGLKIGSLDENAAAENIDQAFITEILLARFKQDSIRIESETMEKDLPYLLLNFSLTRIVLSDKRNLGFSLSYSLDLYEQAQLRRNPGSTQFVVTWSKDGLVTCPIGQVRRLLHNIFWKLADSFSEDYTQGGGKKVLEQESGGTTLKAKEKKKPTNRRTKRH